MNNQMTAIFDAWIARQYYRLKQRIISTCIFDEDAFQDTYLSMREGLPANSDGSNFESIYIELYKQILSHKYNRECRYSHPDPLFFIFLKSEQAEPFEENSKTNKNSIQAKQVDDYVKYNFSSHDYMIFYLKFFEGMKWQGLIDYTGQSSSTIARRINCIKQSVILHFTPYTINLS